jgi:hypothetical protein
MISQHEDRTGPIREWPRETAVIIGILSVVPHLFLPRAASLGFAAVLMGVIAGVYFGFAVMKGALREQITELSVAGGFGLAALLGLTVNPWLLPGAYLSHAFWDFAHHNRARLKLVSIPQWYVGWCATIDVLTALGLAAVWRSTGIL